MIAINQNPLYRLSDSQLIQRLDALVHKERETTLEVIRHIIEFDRRKLYLGIGYSSLYDYCTMHLGMSESAAMRRIKTARCIREFPEIFSLLTKNELNLTSVCMIAGILNDDNKKEVLKESRFKSKRQMEEIVGRYKPGKDMSDRVRTIFVKTPLEEAADAIAAHANESGNKSFNDIRSNPDNSKQQNWVKSTTAGGGEKSAASSALGPCISGTAPAHATVLKKKYKLEFTIEPECMKNLEEAKAILSTKYPKGVALGKLLEEALDAYLDKHSPERKKKRREKREAKKQERKSEEQDNRAQENKIEKYGKKNSRKNKTEVRSSENRSPKYSKHEDNRYIPQTVQDEVFARDEGRCAYVSPGGMRCNSTWDLQIDHIIPFAKGGGHSMDNLRILCRAHNQHEAETTYGKQYMERQRKKAG
jgi:5-methylcytosine-specific restriction endonuclease McrA